VGPRTGLDDVEERNVLPPSGRYFICILFYCIVLFNEPTRNNVKGSVVLALENFEFHPVDIFRDPGSMYREME
jgi:hypothetical protein